MESVRDVIDGSGGCLGGLAKLCEKTIEGLGRAEDAHYKLANGMCCFLGILWGGGSALTTGLFQKDALQSSLVAAKSGIMAQYKTITRLVVKA